MSLTGIVLYFVPQGRIAFWANWEFLRLTRTAWINIHILSSILFLVAGLYHIYNNWHALWRCVWDKVRHTIPLRRELMISTIVTILFTLGAIYLFPPFNYVISFSDYLKSSWLKSKDYEPPFGHAELLSLRAFSKRMNIDLPKAVDELMRSGIKVDENGNETLLTIARQNGRAPVDLYMLIKKYEMKTESTVQPATAAERAATPGAQMQGESRERRPQHKGEEMSKKVYTEDMVIERFEGKGVGRKTVKSACQESGIELQKALKKLAAKGMAVGENDTLKEIAIKHNTLPIEILKVILVGEEVRE
jgi:hypothetical protein